MASPNGGATSSATEKTSTFDRSFTMSAVDTSIQQMQQAAADQARLMSVSMAAGATISGAAATAQTVNGANAAGTEVAKSTGNDIRQSAKQN
jgi:hypothetical protein